MSIDTRTSKEGDELAIMITGIVGSFRAKIVGFSERHDGTAILQVLDKNSGQSHSQWPMRLKGDDYIVMSTWAEHAKS